MAETPIIDAAIRAAIAPGGNIEEVCLRFLRAALPWDLPDERVEAMARAHCDRRGYTRITVAEREIILVNYRADPIIRELYPERFRG